MFSFLKRLFGNSSTPSVSSSARDPQKPIFAKTVECLTLSHEDEVPRNKWYRRSNWQSEHFIKIETDWDDGWKVFETEEEVVGVTFDSRTINFLRLCDQPEFKVFLEKDPSNREDPNAVKVMASAKIEEKPIIEQLGFLSRHTAKQLKDEEELDARPHSAYLPVNGKQFGLRIRVLVRSKKYRDKVYGKAAKPVPFMKAWGPEPWTKDDENNLEPIYELFSEQESREWYCIKKPSKKLIKDAVKKLHEEGVSSSEAINQIDRLVEIIIGWKPDLEKE